MIPFHINPEEAVQIHLDVKSKKSIGIHWATFVLTDEVGFCYLDFFIILFKIYFIFLKVLFGASDKTIRSLEEIRFRQEQLYHYETWRIN
jgi:hypothetical protein